MVDPTPEERLERLAAAVEKCSPLAKDTAPKWEQSCESAFQEFRLRTVHLRRDPATLDVINDKAGAWRFLCRFSQSRPFMNDRCIEVLRILMQCEDWMQVYASDPSLQLTLPSPFLDELHKRVREVVPDFESKAKSMQPSNLAIVVHRCVRTRVLVDEEGQQWDEIGRGLVVFVGFAKGATEAALGAAARFLLTAKLAARAPGSAPALPDVEEPEAEEPAASSPQRLEVSPVASSGSRQPGRPPMAGSSSLASGRSPTAGNRSPSGRAPMDSSRSLLSAAGSVQRCVSGGLPPSALADAEAITTLCRQGEDLGLVLLPQETLCSEVDEGACSLQYVGCCARERAEGLLSSFAEVLRTTAAETIGTAAPAKELKIICGNFGSLEHMEMTVVGAFMHVFHFS